MIKGRPNPMYPAAQSKDALSTSRAIAVKGALDQNSVELLKSYCLSLISLRVNHLNLQE